MKTFDEAMATAIDRRPFSNNTEWEVWSYNHCDDCFHVETCPLILVALHGKTPVEWPRDEDGELGDCSEFVLAADPEEPVEPLVVPEPVPVLPGQLDLLGGAA